MPACAVDTSCMVAAVCSWHEHHAAAAAELERRLARGETLVIPAPALVEAYAVLTRLPAPHRLAPRDAWTLLEQNFATLGTPVTLSGKACVRLLGRLVSEGVAGGRTYDAVIGECARTGNADTLLTFNVRDFDPPPVGVNVVRPA